MDLPEPPAGTWIILLAVAIGLVVAVTQPVRKVTQPDPDDRDAIEDAIDRSCTSDSQCRLIRTGCCPGCGAGSPVNTDSMERVRELVKRHCSQQDTDLCPTPYCVRPSGGALEPVAVCDAGRCERSRQLVCESYCSFREAEGNMSEEARYTARQLNTTVARLDERCNCGG